MQPIKSIKPRELTPGLVGYYAHGKSLTFGYIELEEGSSIGEHHHPHEQITYIIEGHLEMIIGGETCDLTPGMVQIIPSNTPHSAIARKKCVAIDAFTPVREDYR